MILSALICTTMKKKENYLYIKLLFAYNKLYYTGDFGTFVFGKTICNIFNFFKGERINIEYWQEKCESASEPIIPDEVDIVKLEEEVRKELEEREIESDDIEEKISDCFYCMDSNAVRAYDDIEKLFDDLGISNPGENAYYAVRAAQGYSGRFIFACEVIQWVSNNLDDWLGENKNGV